MVNRLLRWSLYSILLVSLIGCGQKWSQSEKENAEHFIQSIRLVVQAHGVSNKRGAIAMSRADFDEMLSLYKNALSEAAIVTDEVLAKAHPELPKNYRLYFQKGMELRISSWESSRPYEEIQGSALMDSWGDWFEQNRRNIKIPRGEMPN